VGQGSSPTNPGACQTGLPVYVVCAGERAAIDIAGGARWERLAPVTLDNLDCPELIYGPHRSICLDLTFAILPPIDGPYATLDLISSPTATSCWCRRGSPLAEAGVRPDAAALERTPMIGSQWERRTIDASLRERGIEPTVVYRSDDSGTVLAFVAAGTGIVLVPELALDGHDERIVRVGRRRAPGAAPHRAGLAPRAPAELGRRAFMELARSVCGPLGAASPA